MKHNELMNEIKKDARNGEKVKEAAFSLLFDEAVDALEKAAAEKAAAEKAEKAEKARQAYLNYLCRPRRVYIRNRGNF